MGWESLESTETCGVFRVPRNHLPIWLVVWTPLKKNKSQLGWLFPILMGIHKKWQPNHQPAIWMHLQTRESLEDFMWFYVIHPTWWLKIDVENPHRTSSLKIFRTVFFHLRCSGMIMWTWWFFMGIWRANHLIPCSYFMHPALWEPKTRVSKGSTGI